MVKLISSDQEQKLFNAMTAVINETNIGSDPNHTIAKYANINGFTPEFACRMVEAFNTSKTIKHLNDTTGEKRAESFPLADKTEVLRIMLTPETVIKIADDIMQHKVTVDFNKLPVVSKSCSFEKIASEQQTVLKPETVTTEKLSRVIARTEGYLSKIANGKRELQFDVSRAKEKIASAVIELSNALREPGAPDFEQIESAMIYKWGALGKQAMDMVWASADFNAFGEKRAAVTVIPTIFRKGRRADSAAESLMHEIEKYSEALNEKDSFEKLAEQAEKWLSEQLKYITTGNYKQAEGEAESGGSGEFFHMSGNPTKFEALTEFSKMTPGTPLEAARMEAALEDAKNPNILYGWKKVQELNKDLVDQQATAQAAQADQEAALANILLGRNDIPLVPSWGPELISNEAPEVSSILNPAHERTLRSARLQVLANDMIANDEVLSAYAPEDVINAINEVARMAPALATNPLLMRGMVARVLQQRGRIDPAEVDQLLGAEHKQRQVSARGI